MSRKHAAEPDMEMYMCVQQRVSGEAEQYILNRIIEEVEGSADNWREGADRNKSFKVQQPDYDKAGRSDFIKGARELERQGLVSIKWHSIGYEIERIRYKLKDMDRIYEAAGREPKWRLLREARECVEEYSEKNQVPWLEEYYRDLLAEIEKGKYPSDMKNHGTLLFQCLNAAAALREPVFVRIFSSHHLKGSKVFEDRLQSRVIAIGKKYHPMIDDAMKDSQILSQMYLETYTQEMALKGELRIVLGGREVDLSQFPYGLVLNTETLKNAGIAPAQKIRKIVTVENKANYMSMPFEEGTLILFSHGFFSPLEREFLARLEKVLEASGGDVEYYHTGDLDYGGVRIFRYIRTNLFPKLRPWQMDAAQYDRYLDYAAEMEKSSWEKLKGMEEPLLQPLIERILKERKVIEQECFLF